MDELHAGRERHVPLPAMAAELRRGEGQQRPETLAASGDDVRRQLRDERDRALHPLDDEAVARLEVVGDERGERVERVFGAAGCARRLDRGSRGRGRLRIHVA